MTNSAPSLDVDGTGTNEIIDFVAATAGPYYVAIAGKFLDGGAFMLESTRTAP